MTRAVVLLFVALLAVGGAVAGAAAAQDVETVQPVELVLFYGEGCPYCAAERAFLEELAADRPDLVVREYETWYDEANRRRFEAMAAAVGIEPRAVPTTFLGDRVWVGFDDGIATQVEAAVDAALSGTEAPEVERTIEVPFVGAVDIGDRSLLVATLLIGFVDGVNPCSLWVLSILLALVLHSGSRRRVTTVGGTFLAVTSAMYGLYIVGIYGVLSYVGYLTWIQRGVALVVGTLGVLQLREALGPDGGPHLGLPARARPGMYRRMRGLAVADQPLPVVIGATVTLAVGVSLLETPCTIGLPVLWTDLLARSDVAPMGAVLLFLVYLAVFLVDELLLFAIAVVTMRAVKLQEQHGRELKLVSGVVMVTLALVMLVAPALMETVGGALAVFTVAVAVSALVTLVDRRRAGLRLRRPGPRTKVPMATPAARAGKGVGPLGRRGR